MFKIMQVSLKKYYTAAAVYPFVFSAVSGIALSIIHDGSGFESEWHTNDGFVETIALIIGLSVILAVFSSTIFLNNFSSIKTNIFYSFLSWMIPTTSICLFIIYQELQNFMIHSEIEENKILDGYIMLVAIVHLGSTIITFILFQRNFRNKQCR
jgi:hypothetical protein